MAHLVIQLHRTEHHIDNTVEVRLAGRLCVSRTHGGSDIDRQDWKENQHWSSSPSLYDSLSTMSRRSSKKLSRDQSFIG